eukprot:Phypoly_transcript_04387.p1 GENE.Phypoly_transcript_04387~~Phypoly_transcript_04387.p1  ORF type:complete len:576 (+),score=82.20 Phypoly_transcript_04387:125-1852(+)
MRLGKSYNRRRHLEITTPKECNYGRKCFTEGCVFYHPKGREVDEPKGSRMCRFGDQCRTPECPYKHAQGERSVACKYGSDCMRDDCVFSHPTGSKNKKEEKNPAVVMCRYGRECHTVNCLFSHPDDEQTLLPNLDGPKYWTSIANKEVRVTSIDVTKNTIHEVQKLFDETCVEDYIGQGRDSRGLSHAGLQVVKVERIENEFLWKIYSAKKHFIQLSSNSVGEFWEKHPSQQKSSTPLVTEVVTLTGKLWEKHSLDKGLNELYLFHGTKHNYVEAIKSTGFDERVSSSAGLFGTGIYFAENSSKSDEYVVPGKDNIYCHIFICRVCVGTPFLTGKPHPNLRRPPCLLEDQLPCAHPRFDSLIGMKSEEKGDKKTFLRKYREFVVYDRQQCYPEFLVTYRRETKSENQIRKAEEMEEEKRRKKHEEEKRIKEEAERKKQEEEKKRQEEEEKKRALEAESKIQGLLLQKSSFSTTAPVFVPTAFSPSATITGSTFTPAAAFVHSTILTPASHTKVPLFVPPTTSGYSSPTLTSIHPPSSVPCKFGSICSRSDCMFAHPGTQLIFFFDLLFGIYQFST